MSNHANNVVIHFCNGHPSVFLFIGGLNTQWYCPLDGKAMISKKVSNEWVQGWENGALKEAQQKGFKNLRVFQEFTLSRAQFDIGSGRPLEQKSGLEKK